MKKNIKLVLIAIILILCFVSCREASSVIQDPNEIVLGGTLNTYASRFDFFWRAFNSHYVFWDVDKTDWDAVYEKYLPMFEELDTNVKLSSPENKNNVINTSFNSASNYYDDLTSTLVDHHLYIKIFDPYNAENDKAILPCSKELKNRSYYHPSYLSTKTDDDKKIYTWTEGKEIVSFFNENNISNPINLMNENEIAVSYYDKYNKETKKGEALTGDVVSAYCIAYDLTLNKKSSSGTNMHVLYLAMSNYLAYEWIRTYNSSDKCPENTEDAFKWKAGNTLFRFFKTVADYYDCGELGGLILDNRANGGGYNSDLYCFLGLYTDKPVTLAYSKYKEGFGKTDYSSEIPYNINPNKKNTYYRDLVNADIPYVVLCDINSVSNGEVTTAGISSLKNGYTIGERTHGGTGPLMGDPKYLYVTQGGTFGNEMNGPFYVYSSTWNTRIYTKDGYKSIEGYGVVPNEIIEFKSSGKDNTVSDVKTMLNAQMQKALAYIENY